MRTLATIAFLALATLPAQADGPARGVVELFTSQGCSSCPPADREFSGIVGREGVVALSWHVDYWDYLGWKDTFSSAAATARQGAYGRRLGDGSYTPEFVVNGSRGSSSSGITGGLSGLPVAVSVSGGKVTVGSGSGSANIVLVNYRSSASVPIQRGENAGRTVTYHNIVSDARNLGTWNGSALTVSGAGSGGCAVLLQRAGTGAIIGAAKC